MDLKEERKLWEKGYRVIVGLDESGRGALAGPVVAAAVMIKKSKIKNLKILKQIKDSKKLTPKQRKNLYKILINSDLIEWGIGKVGPRVIDRINILEATKLAMKRAVRNLKSKVKSQKSKIDFLILDGNFKINSSLLQKSVIKGDGKIVSCAVASILAKVTRDEAMQRYHKKYPQYGFDKHKGYPTRYHKKMLKKYGPCKIHRKSFKPLISLKSFLLKLEKLENA